jgi:hypothetical protein
MYCAEPASRAAQRCTASLAKAGLTVSATVCESDKVIDLALLELDGSSAVVRCVEGVTEKDVHALREMLAQRDFDRAFIVYTAEDQPHLSGEIESYPLSRIDELAAALARESAP